MSQTDKTTIEPPSPELETQPSNQVEISGFNPPAPTRPAGKTRPWPVSVLNLLLLLQAGGLLDLGLFFLNGGLGLSRSLMIEALLAEPIDTRAEGIIFILLSLVALLAAIGFARLWRTAWLTAMLLQGLSLLTALVLYFNNQKPGYVYMIMLYSILMVLYLNYFEVYATFQPAAALEEQEDEP